MDCALEGTREGTLDGALDGLRDTTLDGMPDLPIWDRINLKDHQLLIALAVLALSHRTTELVIIDSYKYRDNERIVKY